MIMAYVTTYDSSDLHAWSGLGFHIEQALKDAGLESRKIGNLEVPRSMVLSAKSLYYNKFSSKRYLRDREPAVLKAFAAQVEKALEATNCDVVLSPGTIPIAFLRTSKPVVFWTDATFAGMVGFYPGFTDLSRETLRTGNRMEQAALSKCRLAIYSSEWASRTALDNYEVDPNKVKVVPFGANTDRDFTIEAVGDALSSKRTRKCRLLFVGVDWIRKGGDVAVGVARALNEKGLETELHVVGCVPPAPVPGFVKVHGHLSKKARDDSAVLDDLYRTSHFLIVPSRAECFGIVFAEASSYGLPSISTNVGGIPSVIVDGLNGRMFDLKASVGEYCDYVLDLMSSSERYGRLSLSTFGEYKARLNWSSAGQAVAQLISDSCQEASDSDAEASLT